MSSHTACSSKYFLQVMYSERCCLCCVCVSCSLRWNRVRWPSTALPSITTETCWSPERPTGWYDSSVRKLMFIRWSCGVSAARLHVFLRLSLDMQRYESALSWNAHDGEVYSVEFSSDENTVFSIGEDGKVTAALVIPSFSQCSLNVTVSVSLLDQWHRPIGSRKIILSHLKVILIGPRFKSRLSAWLWLMEWVYRKVKRI